MGIGPAYLGPAQRTEQRLMVLHQPCCPQPHGLLAALMHETPEDPPAPSSLGFPLLWGKASISEGPFACQMCP